MRQLFDKLMAALRREPVRVWLYTISVPTFAFLAREGVIELDRVETYTLLLATVLGVEGARRKTVPHVAGTRQGDPAAREPDPHPALSYDPMPGELLADVDADLPAHLTEPDDLDAVAARDRHATAAAT